VINVPSWTFIFFAGKLTIFKKNSKKWFTKDMLMDIITVVSKKFRRRSKKMMMKLKAAVTSNVTWITTAYVNDLHSTNGNGLLN
jgi:hypothetical protein